MHICHIAPLSCSVVSNNNYGRAHVQETEQRWSAAKAVHSQQTKCRPMRALLCSITSPCTCGKSEWKNQSSCSEIGQMPGPGLYSDETGYDSYQN